MIIFRANECRLARTTTYYFDPISGNDSTGVPNDTGHPYQTSTKAQALHDALGAGGDAAFLIKRGRTYRQRTRWINATKPNITIGAYGTGTKPLLTSFTLQYNNGTSWTAQSGNVWKRTEANDVAWFREANDINNVYTRCTSIAEVNSTEASFWYDSGTTTLYIHRRQTATATIDPNNDGRDYEAVISTTGTTAGTTVEGIKISGDGSRVDNLRIDGYGISRTDGHTSSYNLVLGMTGTDAGLVTNCEFYYSTDHLMGHLSATSGGITTWANCRYGYGCPVNAGTVGFVAYASTGGHEVFCYGLECVAADLPYTGNTGAAAAPNGLAGLAHTGTGTLALAIAWNCRVIAGPLEAVSVWHWNNAPSNASDLAATRAVIVDNWHPAGTVGNVHNKLGYINNVYINPYFEVAQNAKTYANWAGGLQVFLSNDPDAAHAGEILNGRFVFTMPNFTVPNNDLRIFCAAYGHDSTICFYGCRLEWRVHGEGLAVGFDGTTVYNAEAASATSKMAGSLWVTIGDYATGGYGGRFVAFKNNATNLIGNVYCGLKTSQGRIDTQGGGTEVTGGAGYDQDATAIATDQIPVDAPPQGTQYVTTSPIMVRGYPLEYDALWRRRNYATARGPFERIMIGVGVSSAAEIASGLAFDLGF